MSWAAAEAQICEGLRAALGGGGAVPSGTDLRGLLPGPRILRAAAAAGAAPAGSAALAPATRGPAPRPPPLQLPAPCHQLPGSGEMVGGRGWGREVSATLYLSENRVCWLFGLDA